MKASGRTTYRTLVATAAVAMLAACGGADTAADKVDTTGVTAVGSGTKAGDSANAVAGGSGSLMGDSATRDTVLGDSAGHDTINRRPGTATGTRRP